MNSFQMIVIGGGPAGLTAAGRAAELGAKVLLVEKMDRPGRKLSITGKGRCNLTNIAPLEVFLDHFGPNGNFLYQAFSRFFSHDLIDLLSRFGVSTITERGGRVFPATEQASDIVGALLQWIRASDVKIITHSKIDKLLIESGKIKGVKLVHSDPQSHAPFKSTSSDTILADAVIIATGGASYPGTGSTGDGYRLARLVGHTVVPIRPALVPLVTDGDTAARLQGVSLKNISVQVWVDGEKRQEAFGEMLFTHYGISGPIILTMSKGIVDALHQNQHVLISIDLKPALDESKLDIKLLRNFRTDGKKHFQTLLKSLLPTKMIPVCLDDVQIPAEKAGHQITAEERKRLRQWLKDLRLHVTGHRPLEEAIVTAGGIHLKEVDPRTLQSRIIKGLYFAGEILNLDADTGGYNLQASFSTGWLAGESSFRKMSS